MNRQHVARGLLIAVLFGGILTNGCNREAAQPLTGDAFVSKRVEGRADPEPIDTPGQVIVGGVKPPVETREVPENKQPIHAISPTVQNATREPSHDAKSTPPAKAAARASAGPATKDSAVDPSGQYVILGTVLANVNTRPIYAHKLLSVLDSALRAEAQRLDERQFRTTAAELIEKELRSQVREEVVYAVAEKSLDAREREFAEMLTAQWKNQEVTRAGGSLEIAKRRWADEGWEAQDRLDYQYRLSMNQIFYQRRVFPLVHVTAKELRDYYEKNKDTEFTRPARVKFRVIRIDPKSMKISRDEAKALSERTHESALKGNFEALARETNDLALRSSGGIVPGSDKGYLPKGTYVSEKLEDAVWSLRPGAVTNVIEDRNAFYIAKLEDRQEGAAIEFEDLGVQEKIRETLLAQQYRKLQDQFQEKLIKESVIQEHPQMRQIALDMAMQRYRAWTSTARSAP
jgi:peptidyl-prolyl cis-trans isomerase C